MCRTSAPNRGCELAEILELERPGPGGEFRLNQGAGKSRSLQFGEVGRGSLVELFRGGGGHTATRGPTACSVNGGFERR